MGLLQYFYLFIEFTSYSEILFYFIQSFVFSWTSVRALFPSYSSSFKSLFEHACSCSFNFFLFNIHLSFPFGDLNYRFNGLRHSILPFFLLNSFFLFLSWNMDICS